MKPSRDIRLALLVIALAIATACGAVRQPSPELTNQLVDVGLTYPDIELDIRYASPDNFLGRAVYTAARCYLVTDAAQRLSAADMALRTEGFRLIVWDCYRPRSVQYAMWEILPDPTYVADPARGSRHNRGAAVDVGVVGLDGEP
ncbi:MAG: M15 family metallopeptidase, partial [Gemmatimonadota bacterium]